VQLAGLLMMDILPFAGVLFGHGWIQAFSAIAVLIALGFHVGVAWVMRVSQLYALTHPLGAALFFYMLLRSTVVTLRQGGIVWRDTFYPLEELKRGIV
jgi:2-keto-4-pentenoate hydratase